MISNLKTLSEIVAIVGGIGGWCFGIANFLYFMPDSKQQATVDNFKSQLVSMPIYTDAKNTIVSVTERYLNSHFYEMNGKILATSSEQEKRQLLIMKHENMISMVEDNSLQGEVGLILDYFDYMYHVCVEEVRCEEKDVLRYFDDEIYFYWSTFKPYVYEFRTRVPASSDPFGFGLEQFYLTRQEQSQQ